MPRVRTDEKRAEIVRAASALFEELGYCGCTMSTISERLGGSKATIYGYFRSKEELLRAVLQCQPASKFDDLLGQLSAEPDLRESLVRLGIAYQNERLSPLFVGKMRAIVNQPTCLEIGAEFYEEGIRPAFQRLESQLKQLMDCGTLRADDPSVAAMHWKGLNDWDFFEQRLQGAIGGVDASTIKRVATSAADAFLKLYGK